MRQMLQTRRLTGSVASGTALREGRQQYMYNWQSGGRRSSERLFNAGACETKDAADQRGSEADLYAQAGAGDWCATWPSTQVPLYPCRR